jgi:hypothetical protein
MPAPPAIADKPADNAAAAETTEFSVSNFGMGVTVNAEALRNEEPMFEEPTTPTRPKVWTVAEVLEEYFPGAKKVSGGVLAGIQREVRRRNRRAEKGF